MGPRQARGHFGTEIGMSGVLPVYVWERNINHNSQRKERFFAI